MKKRFRHAGELTGEAPVREFVEISIPVPWGKVAGKWYGPQNVRPVLAGHGWLDNAGSFDYLAKLLPNNLAFLAIDLPGHGHSTHLPHGCAYHLLDFVSLIRIIMQHYKWSKVSLVGHSMFGSVCFLFAAIFPNLVDFVLNIDILKPLTPDNDFLIDTINTRTAGLLRELSRVEQEPPSYTYEQIIERQFEGAYQSVCRERCPHLLARNIQVSKQHEDRYFFARDRRIKYYQYAIGSNELVMQMARRITCPFMYIKAKNWHYLDNAQHIKQVLQLMLTKSNFHYVQCEGTHHLHLNTPETMMTPFLQFMQRYANDNFDIGAKKTLSKL